MSPISAELETTLARLAGIMAVASDDWWLIGSAAVALHGADPGRIADIDVLLSKADATRVLTLRGLSIAPGVPDGRFASSIFATLPDMPLPIEFMAGLQLHGDAGWHPVEPLTRVKISGKGWEAFVPERNELASILRSFGRQKDLLRAAALERNQI